MNQIMLQPACFSLSSNLSYMKKFWLQRRNPIYLSSLEEMMIFFTVFKDGAYKIQGFLSQVKTTRNT